MKIENAKVGHTFYLVFNFKDADLRWESMLSYSAGITKVTTCQPTFCVDLDVLLEILEQKRLKHVISPILAIFDFLEQIVLGGKKQKCCVHVLQFKNHQINAYTADMPEYNHATYSKNVTPI